MRESARSLGYVPSRQAALFARKKTCTIGLVVPEYEAFPTFSRPYFPALLDGVVLGAEERGYSVMIVPNKIGRPAADLFSLVSSKTVEGLVFAATPADCVVLRTLWMAQPIGARSCFCYLRQDESCAIINLRTANHFFACAFPEVGLFYFV